MCFTFVQFFDNFLTIVLLIYSFPSVPLRHAADAAARVAAELGEPLPVVALRFALFESGAQVTLVGTTDPAELDVNVAAALAGPLPPDMVQALRAIQVVDEELLNPGNWPAS